MVFPSSPLYGPLSGPTPKPSRRLSIVEVLGDPRLRAWHNMQQDPRDALAGELGIFQNPDGSFSTERSATRRMGKKYVNFPLLVKGQSDAAIQRILLGKPFPEDEDVAFKRLKQRLKDGLSVPTYDTLEDAVRAAVARSRNK